jgi:cation diffusion facilitator CzcD-associated flavoprotein CzcO
LTAAATLADLDTQVGRDLRLVSYPEVDWVPERRHASGRPVLDVLIVGAGQGGLALSFALQRERVSRVLAIDAAPAGAEGPWTNNARMRTLRSWKTVTGPDLDIPSLTYQSWHEAQWGAADFESLVKIPKENWHAYLQWYRGVLGLRVENGTRLTGITPAGGLLEASVDRAGKHGAILARKVVLAHGIEASGRWWMPDFLEHLPRHLRSHSGDAIDFAGLRGKHVAVVGAGASAFDNAATALEAGAATVTLCCRRARLQRVQPYKQISFNGFFRHFRELDDAARWRFMNHLLSMREALPKETWERCTQHANFRVEEGRPWTDARAEGDAVLGITPKGELRADFVIAGTGFEMDLGMRPELSAVAPLAASWADRYAPPPGEENPRLGRYPYLGPDFELTEKEPGTAPWLRDIRVFTFGSTMSFGPAGSSINAMKFAVPRLAAGLTRDFFREDEALFLAALKAYDTPEF